MSSSPDCAEPSYRKQSFVASGEAILSAKAKLSVKLVGGMTSAPNPCGGAYSAPDPLLCAFTQQSSFKPFKHIVQGHTGLTNLI